MQECDACGTFYSGYQCPNGPHTADEYRDAPTSRDYDDADYARNHGDRFEDLRERVLARDGYKCKVCGLSHEVHGQREDLFGAGLHLHHIKPVKAFDHPEDAHYMANLVALCAECHRKAERGDIDVARLV